MCKLYDHRPSAHSSAFPGQPIPAATQLSSFQAILARSIAPVSAGVSMSQATAVPGCPSGVHLLQCMTSCPARQRFICTKGVSKRPPSSSARAHALFSSHQAVADPLHTCTSSLTMHLVPMSQLLRTRSPSSLRTPAGRRLSCLSAEPPWTSAPAAWLS